jgi:hypothetical protein
VKSGCRLTFVIKGIDFNVVDSARIGKKKDLSETRESGGQLNGPIIWTFLSQVLQRGAVFMQIEAIRRQKIGLAWTNQ